MVLLYNNHNMCNYRYFPLICKFSQSTLKGLLFRVEHIGRLPICNCRKDRAPHIGNFSFILCWRCTSIITSFLALKIIDKNGIIEITSLLNSYTIIGFFCAILLIIPTTINGIKQYYWGIESTNKKRILTGILCGIGLYFIIQTLKTMKIFF